MIIKVIIFISTNSKISYKIIVTTNITEIVVIIISINIIVNFSKVKNLI